MFDPTQLSDEDLGAALFDALVEGLDARAREDSSITVVNRMPTAFAVSRRGNLLTLAQGVGRRLLRGDLKWKDRRENPRIFHVSRATVHSKLVITPDRIEGTPDEIVDRIVAMFLEWTAERVAVRAAVEPFRGSGPMPRSATPESRPAPRPKQESRPPARVPPKRSTIREDTQERRPTSTEPTQERRAANPRAAREHPPAPAPLQAEPPASVEIAKQRPPAPQGADKPSESEAEAAVPAPLREIATRTLRTYQLLFETARRELEQAKALPVGSRYFLVSAGVFVAFTAEAFFNDLGSRRIPFWSQLQRLDPREKAEVLNVELFNDRIDWSNSPFQSVAAALGFRRALAHAHTETLSLEQLPIADRNQSEVPRTRRTAWQEHCNVETIQRWIADLGLLIERFSRTDEPA
jgi:hypothetical protein